MTESIYSDLNVRLDNVEPGDVTLVTDSKAVIQSIWRLLNTKEGEIPYQRAYGLDIEKWQQAPMTKRTAQEINDYILEKIANYENRVTLARTPEVYADLDSGYLSFTYYFYVIATQELIQIPTFKVYIG